MQPLNKEKQALENAAAKLLDSALKSGAERAEVFATYSAQTKFSLEKQDYHLASSDAGYQFGLRVLIGAKQGFASTNSIESRGLKEVAEQSLKLAQISPTNPYNTIAPSENALQGAPEQLWDEALHRVSLQTQRDWIKLLMTEASKDKRFRINDGSFSISSSLTLILNSLGTHKVVPETGASWSLMGMAVDGDKITSFDYFQEFSRTHANLLEKLRSSTQRFTERVIQSLGQGTASNYKGSVVFSPRALADVLVSPLLYHLNGRSLVEKTCRWQLSEIGKPILSTKFSLVDDPWKPEFVGCTSFDREGTPTRPISLIEEGRLKAVLTDHYAAKALGIPSSGNAGGGASSIPSVSPHAVSVRTGPKALSELMRVIAPKAYLVVHRFSGDADPITGDFSGVAKAGEWWTNNERAYCLKETLISGNIFDCLGKDLIGLSRESEIVDASGEFPTLVAEGVSVTAGGNFSVS